MQERQKVWDWPAATTLTIVFLVSRSMAALLGLRYATISTAWLWQVLDLEVLHQHLARALLNLHAQPPLYNALIGLAEKLAGVHYGALLLTVNLSLGLASSLALYATLITLRVHPKASLTICLLALLNPAAILCEFDTLYTELVYAQLTFVALALVLYRKTMLRHWLWTALALCTTLTLTRASYQWMWLAALCALLWFSMPTQRRTVAFASAVFITLSLLWPLKNLVLFHQFNSSTWLPYSLQKHWKPNDPFVASAMAEGRLKTFEVPVDAEKDRANQWLAANWPVSGSGAPELYALEKSNGGANWNSLSLLAMHTQQSKEIRYLLQNDPKPLLRDAVRSTALYFQPTSRYMLRSTAEAADNYRKLSPLIHAIDRVCCNLFGMPRSMRVDEQPLSLEHLNDRPTWAESLQALSVGAVALNLATVAALLLAFSKRFWRGDNPRRHITLLLGWTIAWIFIITNALEIGENMRFRYETSSLVWIVAAVFIQQLYENYCSSRRLRLSNHTR